MENIIVFNRLFKVNCLTDFQLLFVILSVDARALIFFLIVKIKLENEDIWPIEV